ncbi:MAG: TaqI-like C-terminal specificity domain-containing protein, partial [Trichormus sp.]
NNGQRLAHDDINNSNWNLTNADSNKLIKQMEFTGISLNEYIQGRIYRGVASGYNNAFYIDENIKEKLIRQNSANLGVIKPLLVGDNIRKWRMASKNKYLLYMYHKIDVSNLSYILEYLEKYRKNLENRAIKQEWYELQQPQFRYAAEFEKPKIIFPDIVKEPRFTFDKEGHYLANTAYIIPVNDLYLLGVLNSRYIWEYAKSRFVCLGDPNQGGRLRFTYQSVINLPIPIASTTEKETISQLVQKCLDAKGVNCETWEKEIDERVAALYGL